MPDLEKFVDLRGKKIILRKEMDCVSVNIYCQDGYFAEVLYEDIVEKARAGGKIYLELFLTKTGGSDG